MKFNITKGKQKTAIRFVGYGPEGIGKSTFASHFPDPLFIDVEGGTKQLDVARFPQPTTWNELLEMVDAVLAEPGICKTLVIDTADRAEALLTAQLLNEAGVDSIEKYGGGYGKGYTALAERFNKDLLMRLDRVIAKGVNVTLIAPAAMRKLESPDEPPYDRWELKVSKKIAPLVKEWTDILCFMKYEQVVVEENGRNKAKGKAKRVMVFNHRPTCDAKNRYGLEDDLPLSFEPLRAIYEGETVPQPQPEVLDIENPNKGIVEDDMAEDPRDILLRTLKKEKVSAKKFEQWLKETGRIGPEDTYMNLSGTAVQNMQNNIEVLIEQIKGGKN
jgi:hypothetical protein